MKYLRLKRGGRVIAGAALSATCLIAGLACAGNPNEDYEVRVEVRDGVLRKEGASCGGGGSYRFLHPTADYQIMSSDGETITTGQLPQGIAVKQFTPEFDDLYEPTTCQFILKLSGLTAMESYSIQISEGKKIAMKYEINEKVFKAVIP